MLQLLQKGTGVVALVPEQDLPFFGLVLTLNPTSSAKINASTKYSCSSCRYF